MTFVMNKKLNKIELFYLLLLLKNNIFDVEKYGIAIIEITVILIFKGCKP